MGIAPGARGNGPFGAWDSPPEPFSVGIASGLRGICPLRAWDLTLEQTSVGIASGARGIDPWRPWDSPLLGARPAAEANPTVRESDTHPDLRFLKSPLWDLPLGLPDRGNRL